MTRAAISVLICLCLCGCAETPLQTPLPPRSEVIAWSAKLMPSTDRWAGEAEKRFGIRPIVFFCHGGQEAGVWHCYPDAPRPRTPVASVAWMLHDLYPGRMILLIVCNGEGSSLDVPGVVYSPRKVWNIPGKWSTGDENDSDFCGSIWDFKVGRMILH